MALPSKLGIIAGGGILPKKLCTFCKARNIQTYVIGLEGHAEPAISDTLMRIGEASKIMPLLRQHGCNELVIIGSVRRPKFSEMRPDFATAMFFAKVGMRAVVDDGLLKAVRSELEKGGFVIHGIHEIMDDLLIQAGVLTKAAPSEEAYEHIHFGLMESRHIGKKDIGQSVVVLGNELLGTEDDNGTNALIKRAGQKGAILVKSSKPQQDRKLDMPTLGSETVRLCASLGYSGIAAEAGGVLIADREEMIAAANEAGLFVVGV